MFLWRELIVNFNLNLDKQLSEQLTIAAKNRSQPINAIINEALSLWFKTNEKSEWPDDVLAYKGIPDFPIFESQREETVDSKGDPFA